MTAILYDGIKGKALRGEGPVKKGAVKIGYLAYPNPKLKNSIPAQQFLEYKRLKEQKGLPQAEGTFKTSGKLEQTVNKAQYIRKIKQIHQLLQAGEIYQMNYAIRFRKKFEGDPYALFLKMVEANPAEYMAYLDFGSFQILTASPERFFKVEGGKIITEPIKGTIGKKGGKKNLEKLLSSDKERAELDMITDLLRNDVGKICEYGTLIVRKNREIKELPNLWHTYSVVEGQLPKKITSDEVLSAMFPGGSVTGCPKKRAMEYIEKLEAFPRNIFTGSIGYITPDKMDFNIAIRTALIQNGFIEYWSGGGIVADSVPEKEYEECLLKAERFLGII